MISKKDSLLRQKDVQTGAEQERQRIMDFLEELYLYEYGRNLTLGKIMWLIKEKTK
jgi:hypothetical protein